MISAAGGLLSEDAQRANTRLQHGGNMANGLVDLHTHTHCSDGKLAPAELIEKASGVGLRAVAITDHDTVEGVEEGRKAGKRWGVEVLSGVELSTRTEGEEIHLLGYGFDLSSDALRQMLRRLERDREERARAIVDRLREQGVTISYEAVRARAKGRAVGRPHVAEVMVEEGYVSSFREAFDKYLQDGGPAYVAKNAPSTAEALALLHEIGGIGVLAHPGQWTSEERIRQLVQQGLDGIEVKHPSHPQWLVSYYAQTAQRFGLIETGGSDYHGHGPRDEDCFGRVGVSYEQWQRVRQAAA